LVKFYGVLSYVWLNPDNIILNNLKDGLIDGIIISSPGYQNNLTYRKWIRRNRKHIPSIMIDHEAWLRFKRGISMPYNAVKQYQVWASYNLKNLGFKDIIVIAPDVIGNELESFEWGSMFQKEYEGNIMYPFHGKMPDGVEYVGIPKENLETDWYDNLPSKNVKLHGLGVSPRNMPMIKEHGFVSCDGTIDSDGWSKNRIEDFRTSLNETKLRMSEK